MANCDELSYASFHDWFEPRFVALLREILDDAIENLDTGRAELNGRLEIQIHTDNGYPETLNRVSSPLTATKLERMQQFLLSLSILNCHMEKVELLFQATTVWLVAVLAMGEVGGPDPGLFAWSVWAVTMSAFYLVPAYVIWRFAAVFRERVWRRWMGFLASE